MQTGSPAAALIGIITLIFIFYILFLPPEERRALLEGDNVTAGEEEENVLLSTTIGRLAFVSRNQFDHPLPNIYLAETRNAQVLAQENPFTIKKGWFSEERKTIVFGINVQNTENVILSLQATERRGVLNIMLNGVKIFEAQVQSQNPPPITLSKTLLRDTNTIELYVTGGFLASKRYSLSDVKIVGDITDPTKQIAINTFSISDAEIDNFESGYLNFYPICEQQEIGQLIIELNDKIISSAVPACESLNRQEIYEEDLRDGKNTLTFKITKGNYRIEQVRIRTMVKPVKAFVDFFDVKSSLYNDVLDKSKKIILTIEFVDDGRAKRAETNVNGKLDVIDQKGPTFTRDISAVVREGNNYLEIRPLTELDIVKLEVRVE